MKIVVFRIFARSVLLIANLRKPETLTLSGRLTASLLAVLPEIASQNLV